MGRKLTFLRNVLILVLVIFLSALSITLWQNYPKSAALAAILKQTLHLAGYISAVASMAFSAVNLYMLICLGNAPQSSTTEGKGRKKPITRKQVMKILLFTIFIAFPSAILVREPGTPIVAGGIQMYLIVYMCTIAGFVLIVTSFAVHVGIFICLVKARGRKRRRIQEDEESLVESRANAGVKGPEPNHKPDGMNKEIDGGKTNVETPAPPTILLGDFIVFAIIAGIRCILVPIYPRGLVDEEREVAIARGIVQKSASEPYQNADYGEKAGCDIQ